MRIAYYLIVTLALLCHHIGNADDSSSNEEESKSNEGDISTITNNSSGHQDKSSNNTSSEISHSNENDELILDRRIIGGKPARRGQFPYVVFLDIYMNENTYFCSGTIITFRAILTAAHCVYMNNQKATFVRAKRTGVLNDEYYYFYSDDIYNHPEFRRATVANDIAVLKLNKEGRKRMSGFGRPPLLPNARVVADIFTNTKATIAGYGFTTDSGPISSNLQYAEVNIITNKECSKFVGIMTPTIICSLNRYTRICDGDSGGPQLINRNSQVYINGVNSFGLGTQCERVLPAGYTFVYPYVTWITSIIND